MVIVASRARRRPLHDRLLLAQVMRERYPTAAQVEREVYARRRPSIEGGTTK